MDISFTRKKDVLIISLIGELDHHSAEDVRSKIDDRIDRDEIKKVILNFNNVSFMDSSGIGVIMGRYKKIKSREGNIVIAGMNSSIDKMFKVGGLYNILTKYDTMEEALKSI
ncbi:anti-sigma F factor antagonist [Clostridium sp. BJN0001]|uniref:anti-sigma F factor antagonist n=1 Tax=Clostridium sp. BJN0001 TaxID=2930219 RepID=UPI001FD1A71C|nr:anti-sigma F factor antagonist [Clostridium sp. BJN0001]